jgi:peptidoglycan/xylan/chitin deacetylase (PgdA/CDA1 family)
LRGPISSSSRERVATRQFWGQHIPTIQPIRRSGTFRLVKKNLVPGAIVILHDGIPDPSRSIEALPNILVAGHQRGLQFVSIGVLIGSGSTPPND